MDRRQFLKYAVAASVGVWAAAELPQRLGLSPDVVGDLFTINPAIAASTVFPQSVASGDPQAHGIVLWTRINPEQGRSGGEVALEIATEPSFRRPLVRGLAGKPDPEQDYVIKAKINSLQLQPFQTYYYRFIYQRGTSPVGRFKTLPEPNDQVRRVRFGFISCQDYTNGYYTALKFLAEEELDFIVHLGDYTYESVDDPTFQGGQVRALQLPSGSNRAETLEDYRYLYQSYRSDRNLQRLHEQFAFINVWDDHEFANDGYQVYDTDTEDVRQNFAPQRRQIANQVWSEYTPTSVEFNPLRGPLNSLRIYRSFAIGNLMELVMTDDRLYRDGPPCGLDTLNRYVTTGCAAREEGDRTMLGATQRDWFLNTLKRSPRIWKVWGNQTMVMQLKLLNLLPGVPPDLILNLDQWDGFPAEREFLLRELKQARVKNFVTITGDLHSFFAGYLRPDFDRRSEDPVGVEFMAGSVTSSTLLEIALDWIQDLPTVNRQSITGEEMKRAFTNILQPSNPHIEFFNVTRHGYGVAEVTPEAFVCEFKVVDTITKPQAQLSTLKVFRVPRDQVRIEDIT